MSKDTELSGSDEETLMRAFPQSKALLLSELEKVLEHTRHFPVTSHQGQLHIAAIKMRALLLAEPYVYRDNQPTQNQDQDSLKHSYRYLKTMIDNQVRGRVNQR